ncbi:hypothetical protein [Streptomyces cadmiisoli]|uniref:hypothetical protein n=1 Tax=Streptomyces cadmiisoli TaxID=2184053 RepID=UPI00364B8828
MAGYRTRWAMVATMVVAVGGGIAGCTDENTPSGRVGDAASAASSAAVAASSAASRATDVWASATAKAGQKIEDIKGGVDVTKDVTLAAPKTADSRTTVEVTARNTTDSSKTFAVQVNFTNQSGDLRDAVVVTVSDVPAGQSGRATARSTHELPAQVKADVARAVRY